MTNNDADDLDAGANQSQNHPAIDLVSPGANTVISGRLDSTPNTTFVLDFYSNNTADPAGHGEGQTYLGSATVMTNGVGVASFNETLIGVSTSVGDVIASTATDAAGNTSEFGVATAASRPAIDLDANDSSGATGNEFTGSFLEDSGPVSIADADATIRDALGTLQSLQIILTNSLDGGDEILAADTTGTSISANYVGNVLTLSGNATLAEYQQFLRTATYENTSDTPNTTTRMFFIDADNGTLRSNSAISNLQVAAVDDAPVAGSDSYNIQQNETLVAVAATGLLANDSDVDSANLAATLLGNPTGGAITLNTDGSFTYVADPLFFGTDEFTYQVSDGNQATTETVSIVVEQINSPPEEGESNTGGGDPGGSDDGGTPEVKPAPPELKPPDEDPRDRFEDPNDDEEDELLIQVGLAPNADKEDGDRSDSSSATQSKFGIRERGRYGAVLYSSTPTPTLPVDIERQLDHVEPPIDVIAASKDSALLQPEYVSTWKSDALLLNELNSLQQQFQGEINSLSFSSGVMSSTGVALTIGYTVWTVQAGYIAAALLSSVPVWQTIDPLPILATQQALDISESDDDDDSLAELIDKGQS